VAFGQITYTAVRGKLQRAKQQPADQLLAELSRLLPKR
jgi:hypothetical protein